MDDYDNDDDILVLVADSSFLPIIVWTDHTSDREASAKFKYARGVLIVLFLATWISFARDHYTLASDFQHRI